jgi:hypothetical protein
LPINFKSYIQANRTFISEIEEYEKILKGLDFSKNLLNGQMNVDLTLVNLNAIFSELLIMIII